MSVAVASDAACSSTAVRTTVMLAAGTAGSVTGGGGGGRVAEDELPLWRRSLLVRCMGVTSCMEGGQVDGGRHCWFGGAVAPVVLHLNWDSCDVSIRHELTSASLLYADGFSLNGEASGHCAADYAPVVTAV